MEVHVHDRFILLYRTSMALIESRIIASRRVDDDSMPRGIFQFKLRTNLCRSHTLENGMAHLLHSVRFGSR